MYSDGHKHVTDIKLDSTVVFLNRIHAVVTGTVKIAAVCIRFTLSCIQMDTNMLLMFSDSTVVFLNRIHAVVTGTVIIAAVWIRFTLSCIQMDTNMLLMLS